ncbi:hypothetical protein UFOVP558_23 [uncultured Caudovirales phage]|uniref:Uncharacterized protein n=1 Tax=uncultured Caudovirales phage TaxID=2100421 RepID=A0A6J5MXE4_9CAUD|nr:hypothetical protein UFOVP558_23 [uncultured Caudovirales phage]
MPIWAVICLVGIALNWILLIRELRVLPEGLMGASIAIGLSFIPFLFPLAAFAEYLFEFDSEP